jgi:predicted nuclease with TOPRIM domain
MTDQDIAVVLEEIRSQFKVFGEALQGTREVLGGKIDGLDSRLSRVEMDVSVLKTDVSSVKNDMTDVKDRLQRVERHLDLNGAPPSTRPLKRKPRP